MGSGEQGLLGSLPSGQRSGEAMPRNPEDEFYDSHREILRGKEIITAEGQAVLDEFETLIKEKSRVKSRRTSLKSARENDLKNA